MIIIIILILIIIITIIIIIVVVIVIIIIFIIIIVLNRVLAKEHSGTLRYVGHVHFDSGLPFLVASCRS
jgi:hypothetical protein